MLIFYFCIIILFLPGYISSAVIFEGFFNLSAAIACSYHFVIKMVLLQTKNSLPATNGLPSVERGGVSEFFSRNAFVHSAVVGSEFLKLNAEVAAFFMSCY
jgi:hypothetical protein